MQESARLSIALPTFNRAAFLEASLAAHAAMAADAGVSIIISDNASSDETRVVVGHFQDTAQNIRYYRNEYTITPDKNFEKALGYANSEYVWLLGDTYLIPEETFNAVLKVSKEDDYDLIVVNASGRVRDVEEQVFTDAEELLANIGWHMTCLSTLVYRKHLLQEANFMRYRDTNFLQIGIIFEYLAGKKCKVRWLPHFSVDSLKVKGQEKKSWESEAIRIWTKRWTDFVLSLPSSYDIDAKLKCIMDHGVKSNTFTFYGLKYLRKKKYFNLELLRNYKRYFPFSVKYPLFVLRIIAVLPRWICKI